MGKQIHINGNKYMYVILKVLNNVFYLTCNNLIKNKLVDLGERFNFN